MMTGNKIGRILAAVVIALAILGIAVMLLGIVGTWAINGPLTDSFTELASLAQRGLEAADTALEAVDPVLSELQRAMQQVQQGTEELKTGIQDSTPIVSALSVLVGDDVTPKIEQAAQTLTDVHQAARDLNAAALAINNLPFANIEGVVQATQDFLDLFNGIESKIYELDANVQSLKDGVVEGAVQPNQDLAIELERGLAEVQGETRDLAIRLDAAHETTTRVKSRLPLIFDLLSLFITAVLAFGILAQAALIYLSYLYRRFNRLDLHNALVAQKGDASGAPDSAIDVSTAEEAVEAANDSEGV
jgi:hypothetical protein